MKYLKTLLERLAQSSRLTVREKTRTTSRGGAHKQVAKNIDGNVTQFRDIGDNNDITIGDKTIVNQSNEYAAKYSRLQELRANKLLTGYDETNQKEMDDLKRWLETHPNC